MITFKDYYLQEKMTENEKLIALGLASAAALPFTAHYGQKAGEALADKPPTPIVQAAQPPTQPPPAVVAGQPVAGQPVPDPADPAGPVANPVANNIQAIMDHIQGEEGIRLDSYNDHLGNRTVGIGHLMTQNARDYQLFQELIQFNRRAYDLLYEGRRNLNDDNTEAGIEEGNRRAQTIFQSDVEWKVGVATRVLSNANINIDLLPTVLQIVFVDMTYQGAIGRPAGAIQQALRAHDWVALSTAIDNVATSPRFINTGVETRLGEHRANINANIEGLNSAIIPENNR